ncbi:MAG: helix-turn-helix domain-containing protein [Thermodesulfobacteriota bacterium]
MKHKGSDMRNAAQEAEASPSAVAEEVLEKKLEDIATMLSATETGKSRLYEDIHSIVERSLFRIALRRSNHVKSAAASYLGINRNTFKAKMVKLGMDNNEDW